MRANVIPLPSPRGVHMDAWERRAREDLDARRCDDPKCKALPPNHTTECGKAKVPDLKAARHECGYALGSLGCRLEHGRRQSATPDGPDAA